MSSLLPGEITISDEESTFRFVEDGLVYFLEEESLMSHQERLYKRIPISEIKSPRFSSLPALVKLSSGLNVVITESDSLEFLSAVPSVWDETRVLDARLGEYILLARRHGAEWYIGAMTNWTARDLDLDLSFLGSGLYHADNYRDGPNADRVGVDYHREKRTVPSTERLRIHLAPRRRLGCKDSQEIGVRSRRRTSAARAGPGYFAQKQQVFSVMESCNKVNVNK